MAEPTRLRIFTEQTVEKTCRTHVLQNIYRKNERKRKITEPTSLEIFMIYRTNKETCRIKSLRLFTERMRKLAEQRASAYVSNGRMKVETCRDDEPRSVEFTKRTMIAVPSANLFLTLSTSTQYTPKAGYNYYMYPNVWAFSINYKSANRSTFVMYWGTSQM